MSDTPNAISTKLYPIPNDTASKYQAHVLLTEDRKISKEQAVNELVLLGGKEALPAEIVRTMNIEKALASIQKS